MITTVTLNVAIDKAYQIQGVLTPGEVMRVTQCINTAGGKGLNVAKVVALCKEDVMATGFAGGHTGAHVEELLDEAGVANEFVKIKGESRCCINILDENSKSTEFLEPGATVSDAEIRVFKTLFKELIAKSDVITISGSVPKGVPTTIYADMVNMAKEQRKKVILDTSGELLKEGIKALPSMVKPNIDELEFLLGTKISSRDQVVEAAVKLHKQGIPYVVVSLGGEGALMVCNQGVYRGVPPKLDAVNTVGCGDSMIAAFAVSFSREFDEEEALRFATAVSAANAMSPKTGDFDEAVFKRIYPPVIVEKFA